MLNNPSSQLIHRYFHNISLINVTFNIAIHNSGNLQSLINHFSTALLSDPRQTDCPTTCYRSPALLSRHELATTRDHQDNGICYCGPQLQSYQPASLKPTRTSIYRGRSLHYPPPQHERALTKERSVKPLTT